MVLEKCLSSVLLVGCRLVTATNENRMEVPVNGKNWATIWSSRPTTGPINREVWNKNVTGTQTSTAARFTITKTWKQPKCPSTMNGQIRSGTCTQWNISPRKGWNNAVFSTIDEPRYSHTTWSKSERERQISYDIIYRCYLKIDTNEQISTEIYSDK